MKGIKFTNKSINIGITISSITISFKNSYFLLIHLPSCCWIVHVTAVMRDVTHSLARSREALRVKKYMCSIEVENRFNARLTSSFIL